MSFFKSFFNHGEEQIEQLDDTPIKEFTDKNIDKSEAALSKKDDNVANKLNAENYSSLESEARDIKNGAFQEVDEYGRIVHATSTLKKIVEGEKIDRQNIFGKQFGGTDEIKEIIGKSPTSLDVYENLSTKWREAIDNEKTVIVDISASYDSEQREASMIIGSYYCIDHSNLSDSPSNNPTIDREYFYINGADGKSGIGEDIKGLLKATGHIAGDVGSEVLAEKIGMGDCAGLIDLESIGNVGYHMSAILFSYISEAFHNKKDLLENNVDYSGTRVKHIVDVAEAVQNYGQGTICDIQVTTYDTINETINDIIQGERLENNKLKAKSIEKGLYSED